MEGIRYGCEQGLYGWNVTDCKICFKYGLYYSPVSTPGTFRMLTPIVLEQAFRKAGTELLEPYLVLKFMHHRNIFHGHITMLPNIVQIS